MNNSWHISIRVSGSRVMDMFSSNRKAVASALRAYAEEIDPEGFDEGPVSSFDKDQLAKIGYSIGFLCDHRPDQECFCEPTYYDNNRKKVDPNTVVKIFA